MICGENSAVNLTEDGGSAAMLYCKRWSCETCRPRNRWEVIKKARQGKPNAFLTLTVSSSNYDTPEDAARDLVRAWRLLRRGFERDKGIEKVPFIMVIEKHESGWPHMHLLMRTKFIHWGYIKRRWIELTGSSHVDIRAVRGGKRAEYYISKYIGKDPMAFPGCKRWWRSHNYELEESDLAEEFLPPAKWSKVEKHLRQVASELASMGVIIVEERPGFIEWLDDHPSTPTNFRRRNEDCAKRIAARRGRR